MDLDKIIDAAERSAKSERSDNNIILENHLKHSTVVLSNAELVREGKREDFELMAAIKTLADPTSPPPQQDNE